MPKNEFEKNWKIGNVQNEPYSHLKERIRITVAEDNNVTFDVRPHDETLRTWGEPTRTGTYYPTEHEIRGNFPFNGGPHIYVITISQPNPGRKVLDCQVDDAEAASSRKGIRQAGSWVATDEGG